MRIIPTIMMLIFLSSVVLYGCSSETNRKFPKQEQNMQGNDDMSPEGRRQYNGSMNRSGIPSDGPRGRMDENMQQRFEEMNKQVVDACNDKGDGDACKAQGPMGEAEGKYTYRDGQLACMMKMPDRPMR